jgi:transposase
MSLQPSSPAEVPSQTAAVARAAFPRGNAYMRLRDDFGTVFTDAQFTALFSSRGRPAEAPWRLALVTVLQFAENLSDRRAAEAARGRIDWKYLMGLDLTDPGFDASVLSEFRSRLVAGHAETLLLDTLLTLCRERRLLAARGRQRTDSTHVLGAVRSLNRLGCVTETLRAALNALAVAAPEWLRAHAEETWSERYAKPIDDLYVPQGEAARRAHAEQIGRDGHTLLAAVFSPDAPTWLREIPAVILLGRVWLQNFQIVSVDDETGTEVDADHPNPQTTQVVWRTTSEGIPPSLLMIASPYDPETHYAKKRTTTWIGYKVHLTETCDADRPRLITHVATTLAPVADRDALGSIHADLAAYDLLPDTHLVDAGYVDADLLLASTRNYAVTLLGPSPQDTQWQSRQSGAFRLQDFQIDWDRKIATCPAGHITTSWSPDHNLGRTVMRIRFSSADCKPCALKQNCTRSPRRLLTPRRREEHAALEAARAREVDGAFAEQYRWRAGIEGTLSLGVRTLHLRRARYLGLAKVHLQHVLTAAALNIGRIADWLAGETVASTRRSPFARLISQAA